jgi:hypothetical protein
MGEVEHLDDDLGRVLDHIGKTIGSEPTKWTRWPGGWPGEIGTALVDAVYSARAVYLTKHGKGVLPLVRAWRLKAGSSCTSLSALAAEIEGAGTHAWAESFGSEQHSPGRPSTADGGPWKSAAVLEAAQRLTVLDVDSADQITEENAHRVKSALVSVQGIGFATSNYFLMLLGRPGVKPDRMVHKFLRDATGHAWTNAAAFDVVVSASQSIAGVEPHELDHAIWRYESDQAANRSASGK